MPKFEDYDWSGFTESNWSDLRMDNDPTEETVTISDSGLNDMYGSVYVGNVCFEIQHTFDESDWRPFIELYVYDDDSDGYGITEGGHPYSHPSAVTDLTPDMSFDSYKEFQKAMVEKFNAEIEQNPILTRAASKPLTDWI